MNQPVPDELISAYFDGEVSPDERGEALRLLETSSELRQQLDETSKLSALLHSFPRESAPRDLAVNVQKQVDAASPPALVTAQSAVPATTRRSLRREWTAFGAGMLATMASLLMFVTFNRSPLTTDSPELHQWAANESRSHTASQPKPVDQQVLAETHPRMANANLKEDASAPSETLKRSLAISQPARYKLSKMDDLATQVEPAAKLNDEENLTQKPVPMVASYDSVGISSNSIQPQTQNDFLSYLVNGDVVVSKVADPNNTVAVVDFTVVDIERGSDELKILLQKRSLQQVEFSDEASLLKRVDVDDRLAGQQSAGNKKESDKKRDATRPDEFEVFFVRAPGDQLAETIDDLIKNHPDIYRNWTPQPPIELPVASQPATEGIVAENQAVATASNKPQDQSLGLVSDETTIINAEAEMAVGVLMARNGSVNPNGDFNFNANSPAPLSVSNSIIGNALNTDRKRDFGAPAAASVVPNPTATGLENKLPGNNAQISGNSGQGYFRVSRQNLPHVALQQGSPARNKGAPFVASSTLNTNLDSPGGLGGGMGRNSMVNTNNDSRNPRLVRMLFVLKSGQSTTNPAP